VKQHLALVALGLVVSVALSACEQPTAAPPSPPATPLAATQPPAAPKLGHAASIERILAEIKAQEIARDVTCWTSFRQLDSFIATKPYSDFATLTKIASIKSLTRSVWFKASQLRPGQPVTAADLDAIVKTGPLQANQPGLEAFATELGMRNFTDYRKTSEHWRVVLSVLQDEVLYGSDALGPLTPEGEARLADIVTGLSLELLKTSGRLAFAARTPLIEAPSVRDAHADLLAAHKLQTPVNTGAHPIAPDGPWALHAPTLALIDAKIEALRTYNKTSGSLVEDLNKISKIPIEPEALAVLEADLEAFARLVARGHEPMRNDNFLADGSFAPREQVDRPYVEAVDAENIIAQIIPHVVLPNGDIDLRFVPNPAMPSSAGLPEQNVRLLDYQMNAVRDTAIHWVVLRDIWTERPFAMDPFAAEYLSENISMLMTLHLRRAQTLARQEGSPTITADIARRVRHEGYVIVPPTHSPDPTWDAARLEQKRALLARTPQPLFTDITATSGLKPPTRTAPAAGDRAGVHANIQTVMGAGIGVGDVDADGYPDVFLAGEGLGRLYRNRGPVAPGTFEDITEAAGLPSDLDDVRAALFFDLDGDRDDDLLLIRSSHPSLVLRQQAGHFTDITAATAIATHPGAHSAAVFDADEDGDLDIVIGYYGSDDCNHGTCPDANLPSVDGRNGSPNQLWRQGPGGRFEEVGAQAGVDDVGWTLAVSTADLDGDGHLDLYMANDFGANTMLRARGDGTFEDLTERTQTGDRGSGMNVSFADLDRDGLWDIYVTNIDMFSKSIKVIFAREDAKLNIDDKVLHSFQYIAGNKLYVSRTGDGLGFDAEENVRFEPGDRGWAWAGVFLDLDNDGDDDLYLANGWIAGSFADAQKNQLFLNDGGTLFLAPPEGAEAFAGNSRAVASLDLDRDGDLDLLVNNFRQPPTLLLNTHPATHHWLQVQPVDRGLNTRAVGAVVTVEAGEHTIRRQVTIGLNYLGQDEPALAFGLGDARKVNVEVRWPDGSKTVKKDVAADQRLVITR